jgi:hypothetical protein
MCQATQTAFDAMINLAINVGSRPDLITNSGWGGPPARERREKIRSSLLGKKNGEIRCPRIIRLGFHLPGDDLLDYLNDLIVALGYHSAEDLREDIAIPEKPYICRPTKEPAPCSLSSPRIEIFRHALMLGLCTSQLYDPSRPVIWTRNSLTRVVDLFDPEGFYA